MPIQSLIDAAPVRQIAPEKVRFSFSGVLRSGSINDLVSRLEEEALQLPQIDLGTMHVLAGKVYARTIFIPKGCALTGALHKRDHVNIVSGDISVTTDEGVKRITGFAVLPTKAGMKRAGVAHEDTYWTTVCFTEESDLQAIEDDLVHDAHLLQTRSPGIGCDQLLKLES